MDNSTSTKYNLAPDIDDTVEVLTLDTDELGPFKTPTKLRKDPTCNLLMAFRKKPHLGHSHGHKEKENLGRCEQVFSL